MTHQKKINKEKSALKNHSHWLDVSLGFGPQVYLAAISIFAFFASPMEKVMDTVNVGMARLSAIWPINGSSLLIPRVQ